MITLSLYLIGIAARAEMLALAIPVAYVGGSLLARGPFLIALETGDALIQRLARKLDRKNRGVATLVYRGMIAVLMLVVPAFLIGAGLSYPHPWMAIVSAFLLVAWLGHCFATLPTFQLWRQAKADKLPLQLPRLYFIFADSHAVIRHVIATRMDDFAEGIVGGCFWYLIGGWKTMAIYLVLASAAAAYRQGAAFGWAARGLFTLLDFIPRILTRLLLTLAALFTPHCKPARGFSSKPWRTMIAELLDISLHATNAEGQLVWMGSGPAMLTHQHLRRMLHLLGVAMLLLVLAFAAPNAGNILNKLI